MGKFMLLKQAAEITGHPEYRLRQWCLQKKIRYNKAGNRYIINLDWLEQDLEKMAIANMQDNAVESQTVLGYGKLHKIKA